MEILNINLNDKDINEYERREVNRLLGIISEMKGPNINKIWYIMDYVWNELGCDNINLEWEKISKFYSHPVWLLNGLFIEQDTESMGHREAIAEWLINSSISNVIDYGGGFGTLARVIAKKDRNILIDILEPHPSEYGIKKCKEFENITYIVDTEKQYSCLLSTDVLEHLPNPLEIFSRMVELVETNGYLVIGNCFFPYIKCHLPTTFHLRYTFELFAKINGLEVVGLLKGSHAVIYKKIHNKKPSKIKILIYTIISKVMFPIIKKNENFFKRIKKLLK